MLSQGIWTALVTPLDAQGALNEVALRRLVDLSLRGGVHGVVFAGTTGEGAFLSRPVRYQGLAAVLSEVSGRVPVLMGIEECRPEDVREAVQQAKHGGADAVVVAPPYYERLTDPEIEAFYVDVVEKADFPTVLYHIPQRTHNPLAVEVVARLAKDPRVVGLKDSGGDLDYFRALTQRVPPDTLRCWMGFAGSLEDCMAAQGDGVICAVANVLPHEVRGLWDAVVDAPKRVNGHESLALIRDLERMARQGGGLRLWKAAVEWILEEPVSLAAPLLPVSASEREQLMHLLRPVKERERGTRGGEALPSSALPGVAQRSSRR